MKLNIYIISHPIIKIFSQNTILNNHNTKKQESKIILFMIYEILRKLISLNNIYIRKLDNIKSLSIIDYEQKNYIITNIINNFSLLIDIYDTFPQTEIIHYNIYNKNQVHIEKIHRTNEKANILIIEKFLKEENIITIIKYIKYNLKVDEQNISIACITCTNQILEKISQYYNKINLYTTKIIYN